MIKRGYDDITVSQCKSVFSSLAAVSLDTFARRISVKRKSVTEEIPDDDDDDAIPTEKILINKYKLLKVEAKGKMRKASLTSILNRTSFGNLFSVSQDGNNSSYHSDANYDSVYSHFANNENRFGIISTKELNMSNIHNENENENDFDPESENEKNGRNDKDKNKYKEHSYKSKEHSSAQKDYHRGSRKSTDYTKDFVLVEESSSTTEDVPPRKLLWEPSYSTSKRPKRKEFGECCTIF